MKDLQPEDAIQIKFDAPENEERKKGNMEFFGSLNTTSGNMTTKGVYRNKDDPTLYLTTHLTQFTYFETVVDSEWRFDWLYASPTMWVILISHMYLLLTLIVGLICYKSYNKRLPDATIFDSKQNNEF